MQVDFINPVLQSILNVLKTMAQLEPIPGHPRLKCDNELIYGKHITGLMSMTGNKAKASVALTFTEQAILHIARQMLPIDITEIDGTVIDLAGELCNMVMGGAKEALEKDGLLFELSLPTIIIGNEYLITHRTKSPIILLPFSMPAGDFFVEASFERI